ncbi:hypothetical protein HO133_004016 [Letharia lupina]|uniref:Uncharacterized protein n=1 Tax=Letharia lupina TaxID=560253 RepID=A0A8H6F8U1_9LECA|nr:uncharacterized protein HO133_004016 [Letharia lupina]KAF6219547.1 hypothetical protein HO133_004016 [Letharia lupina]
MDSNLHIDPATFRFPDPPQSSIDGDSSQLHPKRHFPKGSTRLQPRNAGFIYNLEARRLNIYNSEARRLNKQICEELVKGPPSAIGDDKPPPEHRKHSLKTVFSSRSKRKSSKEDKMPIAIHRTSDGRKYGQILSRQIYDSSGNASTYQVNESRRPMGSPASEGQRRHPPAPFDLVGDVNSIVHQVNATQEPVHERSTHRSLETEEAKHRMSPYQTVGFPDPTSESLGNRVLRDRLTNGNTAPGRNGPIEPKPLTEAATVQSSPRKSTTDDSLGLLRDLSQILSQGEATTLTVGASQVPIPEAEYQPRVRDFAANGPAPFSRVHAVIRRRSRSPAKKTGKQTEAPVTPDGSWDAVTCEGQSAKPLNRSPSRIILPPMVFRGPARPPLTPPLPMTQEQVPGTKTSPVINYHSKAPSVVSAESTAEDIQSDASSGVVSNAQSAVFVKVPPQPGPAPLTPLPSLPEGLDSFGPATPRASHSSRRLASPETSSPKVPPQKSPTRSQYKLYPSVDSSPPKRPGSPVRMNAATETEQEMSQPSPPLRSKRRGISFPRLDHLPTSMSVGTPDELEQLKKEGAENTRKRKHRDLARMRSHEATIEAVEPVTRNTVNDQRCHEGVAELPSPRDSYNYALFELKHRTQHSQVSNLSATTTLQYRDSSTLSQRLSPIIIVAEQEPVSPVQRAPSQKSHFGRNSMDEHPRGFKTNGFYPVPPHLASPTLQGPEDESKVRPVSSHSLPVPRPVASRVPTPHLSPLLRRRSHRSSDHSLMHEMSGLEERLSAMERKNAMLESAFLAVINTSAACGGSRGLNGMEGTNGDSSIGLSGKDCDRSSGTSGTGSLYAGLENLLALHSGNAGARWSTSSGP